MAKKQWNENDSLAKAVEWFNQQSSQRAFVRKDTGEIINYEQLSELFARYWNDNPRRFLQFGWSKPWEGNNLFVPYRDDTATSNGLALVQTDPEKEKNKLSDKEIETQGTSSPKTVNQNATPDVTRAAPKLKDDTRIVLFAGNEQMNAALPKWLPSSATIADFKGIVTRMSERERVAFKQQLWSGGYYGSEAIAQRMVPETGVWGTADSAALDAFLSDVNAKKFGQTLNSSLNSKIRLEIPNVRSLTSQALSLDVNVEQLQEYSLKTIGRRLTDQERITLVDTVLGFKDQPQTPTAISDQSMMQGSGKILFGGGPDSTALQYGNQLARQWGLQVVQGYSQANVPVPFEEYRKGLGMSVAGNSEYMLAFHEWARANSGDGKLFKQVQAIYDTDPNSPDRIALVFNENTVAPEISGSDFSYRQDTSIQRFVDSIRRPGEWMAYNWQGSGPSQRGAYAINENVYRSIAQQIGLDSNDYSISAQDAVARIHAENLWKKYNNWELAAVAFKYGDEVADSLAGAGGVEKSNDDGMKKYVKGVTESMASWSPRFAPIGSGQQLYGTQMTPQYGNKNYSSLLMTPGQTEVALKNEFQQQFGKEIAGNRVMSALAYLVSKGKIKLGE